MNYETYPMVVPTLVFNRVCNQAIDLYEKAFDARVKAKMLFSDADPKDLTYEEEDKNLVYYTELMIGKFLIMLHDDHYNFLDKGVKGRATLTSLCVSFDSEEKARVAFEILSDGATILMERTNGSFFDFYVTLIDKFGIAWELYFGDA